VAKVEPRVLDPDHCFVTVASLGAEQADEEAARLHASKLSGELSGFRLGGVALMLEAGQLAVVVIGVGGRQGLVARRLFGRREQALVELAHVLGHRPGCLRGLAQGGGVEVEAQAIGGEGGDHGRLQAVLAAVLADGL